MAAVVGVPVGGVAIAIVIATGHVALRRRNSQRLRGVPGVLPVVVRVAVAVAVPALRAVVQALVSPKAARPLPCNSRPMAGRLSYVRLVERLMPTVPRRVISIASHAVVGVVGRGAGACLAVPRARPAA